MKRLAILASGTGSNADKICRYFKDHDRIEVGVIISNKKSAGVSQVAVEHHIPFEWHSNEDFRSGEEVLKTLRERRIDFIILAGFLRKIPTLLIKSFSRRILNIHPALLPKYGGKGMYGRHVHEAVKEAGDDETGITIHFVNHQYDKGQIIFQASCEIMPSDTPDDISDKVRELEHAYFPRVVESVALADQDLIR